MPRLRAAVREVVRQTAASASASSASPARPSVERPPLQGPPAAPDSPSSPPPLKRQPRKGDLNEASPPLISSPTSTPTASPSTTSPTSSTSSCISTSSTPSSPPPEDDESVLNPLAFPLPLLSLPEIQSAYLSLPHCVAERTLHSSNPRFEDYCLLANTGRAERNVWNVFLVAATHFAERRAVVWLDGEGRVERDWTYGELLGRVKRVAEWLDGQGLKKGDRAVLCFAPGLDYFVAFWACLCLGVVAVPVCPPDPFHPVSDVSAKLAAIIDNCQPSIILTSSDYTLAMEAAKVYNQGKTQPTRPAAVGGSERQLDLYALRFRCIDQLPPVKGTSTWTFPTAIHPSHGLDLAFLQYTSGSTGQPKGVMVGHLNVLTNAVNCTLTTRVQKSFTTYNTALAVSWLPTFHDMGLVGFHIAPMIFGGCVVYFSPLDFLREPLLWLRVLSDWGKKGHVVTTGGPPFALELCAKRLRDAPPSSLSTLDLSSVLSLIVGAEPIRLSSLTAFSAAFAPYGFSPCTLMPAYGLAENVLHVYSKMENTYPPSTLYVDATSLRDGRLMAIPEGREGGKWLVSSGEARSQDPLVSPALPMDGVVLVVKEGGVEADEGEVGEIWLYGKSNTAGYWNDPNATAQTYMGRLKLIKTPAHRKLLKKSWVRTGDLGAFSGGQLYVTGRLKEMICINGQNFYPHDIEDAVRRCHIAIRPGSVVAVATTGPEGEGLAVIVELNAGEGGGEASGGGGGAAAGEATQLGKKDIAMAQKAFKLAQRLPAAARGPAIRGLAKLGAWWMSSGGGKEGGGERQQKGTEVAAPGGPTDAKLQSVETAIKRAVLSRFGIPVADVILARARAVLKTSSGKIRRMATAAALQAGALDGSIIRRSSVPFNPTTTAIPTSSSDPPSIAQFKAQQQRANLWRPERPPTFTALLPSPTPSSSARPALSHPDVKRRVACILAEELKLDADTVLSLSETFTFDEEKTLDHYGLDSVTAMRVAGRLGVEFDLLVPLSPFMFLADPTLDGLCNVVIRLYNTQPAALSAAEREREVGLQVAALAAGGGGGAGGGEQALPCIVGIGCITPGPGAPQLAIMEVMIDAMELPPARAALFRKIGQTCSIDRRYSVLPEMGAIYFGRRGLGQDECVEVRNAVYKREAPKLALEAARRAIDDWGGDKALITHVVAVSCTGVMVPGLEFCVMDGLGLSTTCQRLSVAFMGCFGALSGIKTARAFAAESPRHVVLLVCCELCSLHMQLDGRVDNMVGSALFSDGASSLIVTQPSPSTCPKPPLFELHRSHSLIIPNTQQMMAWELTNTGMSIGLGRDIPTAIYAAIDDFAVGLMKGSEDAWGVEYGQMAWALHPGGPMIIQAICDRLGLKGEERGVKEGWDVLRRYGNMSSATLIFVLHEMRKQSLGGAWVPALAFGPGLNVEGALFRACDGPKQSGRGLKVAVAAAEDAQVKEEQRGDDKEEKAEPKRVQHSAAIDLELRNNTGLL